MKKTTLVFLLLFISYSCSNDGDKYVGEWFGEKYYNTSFNRIEIKKAGAEGYFVKIYHSGVGNERTVYCFFKDGCYFSKEKEDVAITCVNGDGLVLHDGGTYGRQDVNEDEL